MNKQQGRSNKDNEKNRNSVITTITPNSNKLYMNDLMTGVTKEGKNGECQGNLTNLKKWVTNEGILPYIFHEGTKTDQNHDLRAYDNTKTHQQNGNQQLAQTPQKTEASKHGNNAGNNEKQNKEIGNDEKQSKGSMAKEMGNNARTSKP